MAKNDMQRMRNIARGTGKKVMGVGETLMPGKEKSTEEVSKDDALLLPRCTFFTSMCIRVICEWVSFPDGFHCLHA